MYTAQEIAFKIKEIAKQKNITIKKMLEECDLNINYLSQMAKGKQPTMKNLTIIADYLETSTDELLGIVSKNTDNLDILSQELLNQFNSLSVADRSRVIVFIDDLKQAKPT